MNPNARRDKSNIIHSLQPVKEIVKIEKRIIVFSFCFIVSIFLKWCITGFGYTQAGILTTELPTKN